MHKNKPLRNYTALTVWAVTNIVCTFNAILTTMYKALLLISISIILYACPFESTVALEPKPVEPVDTCLLGYWYGIVKDGSDFFGIEALDIKQQSDSVYSIIRYGKAVKGDIILPDTAYFTGYTSNINDQRFMNIEGSIQTEVLNRKKKRYEWKEQKVFYLATLRLGHDTLFVKTITDNFSEQKIFRNPIELKQMINKLSGEKKNIFDDQYSLSYRKIDRPQPVKPL